LNIIPQSKPSKNELLERSKQRSLQRTLDQPTRKPKPSLSKPKTSLWPAPKTNWDDDPHDEKDSRNDVYFWHDRKHHSFIQGWNDTRFNVNAKKDNKRHYDRRIRQTKRVKELYKNWRERYHSTKKGKECLRRKKRRYLKKKKEVRIEGLGKHIIAAFQNASAADIGEQTSENPKSKSNLISILLDV